MSVVFQYAGKMQQQGAPQIRDVFHDFLPAVRDLPGFESARLLVSYATLQAQLLFQFSDYETATKFHHEAYGLLARRLVPIMEGKATAISSVLAASI